jgi:bifunctional DNA-binding transcriptional regulator/antitoxin component of YhaV-PrlF toxin-antitoxin module
MNRDEMDRLTAGLDSKAAKVRALNAAGVGTADIGRYLDIRYQHVYNVLLRAGVIEKGAGAAPTVAFDPDAEIIVAQTDRYGAITLPSEILQRFGLVAGEPVYCRVSDDGILLISREAALRHVTEAARTKMPEQAALIEALLQGKNISKA